MNKVSIKSSLILILTYVVLANMGTVLSKKIDINYLGEILLLLTFTVFLIRYIKRYSLTRVVGLIKINFHDAKKSLLYLPLFVIVLANGVFFFDRTISFNNIILAISFMMLVAFLGELLFRGLLFKSLEKDKTTKTAILISGATFGFGHIINLLNGYTSIDQIIQIVIATLIGILLSVLFVNTQSIIPGIIFHFCFNSASVLSINIEPLYNYICIGIILITALIYLLYLLKSVQRNKDILVENRL